MKITANRQKLKTAIDLVKDAIANNSAMTILQNVLMRTTDDGGVEFVSTNLELQLAAKAECKVEQKGEITLNGKLLISILGTLETDEVTIESNGQSERADIIGGDTKFHMATRPAEEFPLMVVPEEDQTSIEVAKKVLHKALAKTAYAASKDETRRILQSTNIAIDQGELKTAATDGKRLATFKVSTPQITGSFNASIPSPTVRFLTRVLVGGDGDVSVRLGKDCVMVSTDIWEVKSKIFTDEYPNIMNVIPKGNNIVIPIDREAVSSAIRLVSLAAEGEFPNLHVTISNGTMTLTARNGEASQSKSVLPVKYDGADVSVFVNFNFLLDTLGAFDSDTVDIHIKDGHGPLLFTADGETTLAVLMPLRTN